MVVSLFEKYGVVPKSVYPESVSSSSSRELNAILNKLLRQDAQILRDLLASGADQATVQAKKEDLLQEIFNFLAMSLGLPPRKFDFAYRDKDNNYQSEKSITPQEFYKKYVNLPLEDYVSVINCSNLLINLMANLIQLRCWGMWLVAVRFVTSTCRWSA